MKNINNVTVAGYLVRDCDCIYTTNGTSIVNFTVASNISHKTANDEWEDYPNFIDCTVFGKFGEAISDKLSKGTKVMVNGYLRQDRWENEDGSKRSKLYIVVDGIEFGVIKPFEYEEQEPIPDAPDLTRKPVRKTATKRTTRK